MFIHFWWVTAIFLKGVTFSQNFQRMYGNLIADMLDLHFAGGAFGQDVLGRGIFQGGF